VRCRYKLTSKGFLNRLLHVRSIMSYNDEERIPAAVALMRQILWVEPQATSLLSFEGRDLAAIRSKLCRHGQLVLLEDRLVCVQSIPALDKSLLST
jgi:hypothetical protein